MQSISGIIIISSIICLIDLALLGFPFLYGKSNNFAYSFSFINPLLSLWWGKVKRLKETNKEKSKETESYIVKASFFLHFLSFSYIWFIIINGCVFLHSKMLLQKQILSQSLYVKSFSKNIYFFEQKTFFLYCIKVLCYEL